MITAQMKPQLFNDNFQNFKKNNIPKAQLVIADIPYNIGSNAYANTAGSTTKHTRAPVMGADGNSKTPVNR